MFIINAMLAISDAQPLLRLLSVTLKIGRDVIPSNIVIKAMFSTEKA